MLTVLTWYLTLLLFGLAAWPIVFSVCHRLADGAYALSKGVGLLLVTYIAWLLAHFAERWPALGFSFATVSGAWYAVLAVGLLCLLRNGTRLWAFARANMRVLLWTEAIFAAGFAAMVALRATAPHISYHVKEWSPFVVFDHAAEKFTDFAILNGLLTSSTFPPHDAWLSGETLNYYYFGHLMWATVIKFSSVRPEVGFNLALAGVAGLCLSLAFALGYNLARRVRWGLLTAFLVVVASNLDGFAQLLLSIKMALVDGVDGAWYSHYDFWRSSRIVAGTINEFPAFSLVLGDLHAHLCGLVLSLCGWHVAVQMWRSARQYTSILRYEWNAWDELFLAALVLGAMSATNSWDVPVMAGVMALALWSGLTGRRNPYEYHPTRWHVVQRAMRAAGAIVIVGMVTLVGCVIFFYPFLAHFAPPQPPYELVSRTVDGATQQNWELGNLLKPVTPQWRTRPVEFMVHWAVLGLVPLLWIAMVTRRRTPASTRTAAPAPGWAVALLLTALGATLMPLWQGWVAVVAFMMAIWLASRLLLDHLPPMSRWVTGLLMIFCLMAWFCEMWYLDDIFSGPIERINTVFKIYYSLWPLMAVATVLCLRMLVRTSKNPRSAATWAAVALALVAGPYIVLGSIHRVAQVTRLGHFQPKDDAPDTPPPSPMLAPEARAKNLEEALDGMRYLAYQHPDDYAAMLWVRSALSADATLLEAAGNQYSYSGRFGTMTGRPSFAGWLGHSWGWRGSRFHWYEVLGDEDGNTRVSEFDRRTNATAAIYNEPNPAAAADMLADNAIDYVVVGEHEREQYPNLQERKFATLGEAVFRKGTTTIYRVGAAANADAPTTGTATLD